MIKTPHHGVYVTEALRPGKNYGTPDLDGATYAEHVVRFYCSAKHPHIGVILNLILPGDFNETEFLEQFKSAMAATPYSVTVNVSKPAVAYQVVIHADKPQPVADVLCACGSRAEGETVTRIPWCANHRPQYDTSSLWSELSDHPKIASISVLQEDGKCEVIAELHPGGECANYCGEGVTLYAALRDVLNRLTYD